MSDTTVANLSGRQKTDSVKPSHVKLGASIKRSEERIQPFRDRRADFVRETAGPYFGQGFRTKRPLNLMFSLLSTLLPALLLDPKYWITARYEDMDGMADLLALNCDAAIEDMKLAKTFESVITDCLFGPGTTKTGIAPSEFGQRDEAGNVLSDPGEAFVESVDLEDWVPDMEARKREERDYEAHRFYLPFYLAWESGMYDTSKLDLLRLKQQGQIQKHKSTADLHRGSTRATDREQYVERVSLMDVWCPGESVVKTVAGTYDDISAVGYLAEVEWDGPETGPYDEWGFTYLPGQPMPVPLFATVYDLYVLVNKLATKMGRQADRSKQILLFSKGSEEDAEAARTSSDGDVVGVMDVKQFANVTLGGADDQGFRTIERLRDYFNIVAGNPNVLGGLEAEAGTLGQEEIKLNRAGVRVNQWRNKARDSTDSVMTKVAFYTVTDPVAVRDLEMELPYNLGSIPVIWDGPMGEIRIGAASTLPIPSKDELFHYLFHINPYQKRAFDPDDQYTRILDWINRVVVPLQQAGMAQGDYINVPKLAELMAKLSGVEDQVRGLYVQGEPVVAPQTAASAAGGNTNVSVFSGGSKPRGFAESDAKPAPTQAQKEQGNV